MTLGVLFCSCRYLATITPSRFCAAFPASVLLVTPFIHRRSDVQAALGLLLGEQGFPRSHLGTIMSTVNLIVQMSTIMNSRWRALNYVTCDAING